MGLKLLHSQISCNSNFTTKQCPNLENPSHQETRPISLKNMQSGDSYAYLFPAANRQSGDYCSHISKLEKSLSEHGDGPPFENNIHLLFKPGPTLDDHHVPITKFHVKFDDEAQGRKDHLGKTTESFQVKEHPDVGRKVHVKEDINIAAGDINTAAGDFISRKHRTYEMQKLMSMRGSDQGSYK